MYGPIGAGTGFRADYRSATSARLPFSGSTTKNVCVFAEHPNPESPVLHNFDHLS